MDTTPPNKQVPPPANANDPRPPQGLQVSEPVVQTKQQSAAAAHSVVSTITGDALADLRMLHSRMKVWLANPPGPPGVDINARLLAFVHADISILAAGLERVLPHFESTPTGVIVHATAEHVADQSPPTRDPAPSVEPLRSARVADDGADATDAAGDQSRVNGVGGQGEGDGGLERGAANPERG